ncbi:hypothetical protein C1E24_20670 [Pseudoalteromonas phenolica]|uniref:DUF1570 domain-containing protein n=1 Tax=Pseudoalteromonas phenolica TaxID=161398 RepID=A0A5R9PW10_9GAMM|nr:hypothetical protein [Pseudoalteromonas phenolica]TLX45108.1 hypothetical protein C1E24_20670 [Pseudoalteromonas phenolica]
MSNKNKGFKIKKVLLFVFLLLVCLIALVNFVVLYQPEKIAVAQPSVLQTRVENVKDEPLIEELETSKYKNNKHVMNEHNEVNEDEHMHVDHPWFAVRPSHEEIDYCNRIPRLPIKVVKRFDAETNQYFLHYKYKDYADLEITAYLKGKYYELEDVFHQEDIKKIYKNARRSINWNYHHYIEWLGLRKVYKSNLKVVIAVTQNDYAELLEKYGSTFDPNKYAGIFFGRHNLSVVKLKTKDNNEIFWRYFNRTMAHELSHAIVFTQVGYLQRWFTEGLAQYMAHSVFTNYPELFMSEKQWKRISSNLSEPLPIDLVVNENDYWDERVSQLYASSFAITQYLALQQADVLAGFLKLERDNKCAPANKSASLSIINPTFSLDSEVQNWFYETVNNYEMNYQEKEYQALNPTASQ